MRTIKFRAWDEHCKVMFTASSARFHPICDGSGIRSLEEQAQADGYILMQFTGLTDKNGKEIYEGDVVKWDDMSDGEYWRVAYVEYGNGNSLEFRCFDCPAIDNSSAHGHVFKFGSFIYTDTENHLEIIGNIYQNPDLIPP